MAEQVDELEVVEQQPETQTEVDAEASFAAGFARARGEEVPAAPEVKPEPEEQAAPEEQATEEAPPVESAAEADQPLFAGLTEEQFKNVVAKANEVDALKGHTEKAFGKIGELVKKLTALEQIKAGGMKVSPDGLKRTAAAFPEMARDLAEDLNEILAQSGGGAAGVNAEQVEQTVSARVAEEVTKVRQGMQDQFLTFLHKDWKQVVRSTDYDLWTKNVLKAEDAQALENSEDALFVADKLTEFKAWKEKVAQSRTSKTKRLEAAVQPTGDAVPSYQPSADEAFVRGFKRARGQL